MLMVRLLCVQGDLRSKYDLQKIFCADKCALPFTCRISTPGHKYRAMHAQRGCLITICGALSCQQACQACAALMR